MPLSRFGPRRLSGIWVPCLIVPWGRVGVSDWTCSVQKALVKSLVRVKCNQVRELSKEYVVYISTKFERRHSLIKLPIGAHPMATHVCSSQVHFLLPYN